MEFMKILTEWLSIALSSAIKFFAGPLLGKVYNIPWWQTAICTFLGMMLAVVLFSTVAKAFFDKYMKGLFNRNAGRITPNKRRMVKVWHRFGISGIAFLTPIILTPIGGSIVAISFGVEPFKIIRYMAVSAAFWSVVASLGIYYIPYNFH